MLLKIMFDECLYFNTVSLTRTLERQWQGAFIAFDLSPSQAFMLRAILRKDGILISEIAQMLNISRPTATRAIDHLVRKNLIIRQSDEIDGRQIKLFASEEAKTLAQKLDDNSKAISTLIKAQIGDDEFANFVNKAKSINHILD